MNLKLRTHLLILVYLRIKDIVVLLSNFMLNGVAGGTLIVVNTYYQSHLGFTSLQAGLISITYLVAVLVMIRVGENYYKN